MILRTMACAAGALFLFSGLSLAQTTFIAGKVKGEDGKPLQGALIKLERTDIRGHYKVKTDKKGNYYYGGLPLGFYDVICEVDGKDVDRVNHIKTTVDVDQNKNVDFDLQRLRARKDALAKAAETGQLTAEQKREMSPEERQALEKATKERQAQLAKNKELNDAFNAGMDSLQKAAAAPQTDRLQLYTDAIASFKKASEMDAKQHVIWAHLGDACFGAALLKTGAEQEALIKEGTDAWQQAIALLPTEAAYHNNFALALARVKKNQEAGEELQKAAQLDVPNAGKYYYNLGALLVNSGQNDAAGEWFKKAIEASPNYAEAHYQYGLYLMGQAKTMPDGKIVPPAGTKEEFEKYVQLAPTGANVDAAKAMLQTIDAQIQTNYTNPNAPPPPQKKTRKK